MTNALTVVTSFTSLRGVWNERRGRLLASCFGVDRVSGTSFGRALQTNLKQLSDELRGDYDPSGLLALAKPKDGGGNRIICVPTIADRLVQFSILEQLRPRLRRTGLDNPISYGLAKGRQRSVIGARQFACLTRDEHPWVYKSDIHQFFDTVDRSILNKAMQPVLPQRSLRPLITRYLHSEISDGIEPGWRKVVADAGIKPGLGVRQGMPLSPYFAGAYLRGLDRWLQRQPFPAARYVDDIVVFFDSEKAARDFHPRLVNQLTKIGLTVGEVDGPNSKTKIYPPHVPASFLGMEITLTPTGYRLCVSAETIEKIHLKFAKLSSVSALVEKGIQLTTLGSFLTSTLWGYRNAYDAAHNFAEFENKLAQISQGTKQTVLMEIFGDKLETMTASQLKFVGADWILRPS